MRSSRAKRRSFVQRRWGTKILDQIIDARDPAHLPRETGLLAAPKQRGQYRCRSRATAARRHARRRLRPTRRSHGARQMGLTWRAKPHQSRSMDAKFGPESAAAAYRARKIGAMSEAYWRDDVAAFH